MRVKPKVLITDLVDDWLINGLVENGYEVNYQPNINQSQVNTLIYEYTGIIITTKIELDADTLHQAVKLKWIARAGSGLDHVDLKIAAEKNIVCITSPEGNAGSVGEHCVAMLLSMLRNIPEANEATKSFTWDTDKFRVTELEGMTIGIIGYGNTGPAFAKRLKGFNVNVIAYDKYKLTFDDGFAKPVQLGELFHQTDVFSIHLPLTDETRNMIDINFLKQFHKPVYLINTSRGNILPVNVLVDALENDLVRMAAIDVLDNEYLGTHTSAKKELHKRLMNHPNLLVTPHIAGKSSMTRRRHAEILLSKILSASIL